MSLSRKDIDYRFRLINRKLVKDGLGWFCKGCGFESRRNKNFEHKKNCEVGLALSEIEEWKLSRAEVLLKEREERLK